MALAPLGDVLAYRLPDDPYASLFGDIPGKLMTSPEEVAVSLADLAERSSVPLRVPVGKLAEQVLAARDAARYDVPFVRG